MVESAHEYDDYGHLSPVGGAAGDLLADMQRKLSQQAEGESRGEEEAEGEIGRRGCSLHNVGN